MSLEGEPRPPVRGLYFINNSAQPEPRGFQGFGVANSAKTEGVQQGPLGVSVRRTREGRKDENIRSLPKAAGGQGPLKTSSTLSPVSSLPLYIEGVNAMIKH